MHLRQAAADKKLVAGAAGGEAKGAAPAGAEVAALRQHLEEAQRYLKRLHGPDRRGKKYLYELPWYILIGPPGSRQDDRADQLRPQIPAGRAARQPAGEGRRRDPQLRLVSDRRGGVAGYRRAVHDAGQRREGGPDGVARLSRPAEGIPPAAADQRRPRRDQPERSDDAAGRAADGACARDPRPACGVAGSFLGQVPGLCPVHQIRPDRRLCRELGFADAGGARAGLGNDLSARSGRRGGCRRRAIRRRIPVAARPPRRAHARPRAAGSGHPPTRPDLRAADPAGVATGDDVRVSRGGLPREPLRDAAAAARRLFHQRHPGGDADRPADGRHRPALRSRTTAPDRLHRRRPQLFPDANSCARWCSRRRASSAPIRGSNADTG